LAMKVAENLEREEERQRRKRELRDEEIARRIQVTTLFHKFTLHD
jgi:hypothetical protein